MSAGEDQPVRRGPPFKIVVFAACFAVLGAAAYAVDRVWLSDDGAAAEEAGGAGAEPGGLSFGAASSAPSAALTAEVDREAARVASGARIAAPHLAIEDPGGAMRAFYLALAALEAGEGARVVRAIHYGDSILTTDHLSGRVRSILQQRFGDGGHGFILLGKPWRWYRHEGVTHGAWGKWRARPITADPLADGLYGLGGVAFEAQRQSHGRVRIGPAAEGDIGRRVSTVDLSYLEQPRGGSFDVIVDGGKRETVETRAPERRVAHKGVEVPRGASRVEIEFNNDGELRVFGAALESGERGVVWDSLAVNGARASVLGRYDRAHWIAELRQRDPRLVVLHFGANEGANRFLVLGEYRKDFAEVIATVREALPEASVLVVGPMDQARRLDTGGLGSAPMPEKLNAVQREVALETGCAFFDTWRAMGGKGSMAGWLGKGLGGADMIHPTEHGARKIGTWIAEALLYGYQNLDADAARPADAGVDGGAR
ncbi:MAG: GDSL-type esterase/lipase family protein [Proteobacteria bacterium]|jgi:lysophospholipase L1-like esterase|nr:GDSL-type esterase/lipase family protein [Pseudomonadota bacterium]